MNKIIGIDVYSALHSPRGMGIYTINFIRELAKLDEENEYILYGDVVDENNVLPQQSNFVYKKLNAKGLFHYEQFVLPKECKKDRIDILHSPANTSPFFLDKNIKRIITLHDLIFLKKEIPLPNNKKQLLGRFYYIMCALLNSSKAKTIFTVSEFSKKDIIKMFHLDPDKIIVTPNGHEHFNCNEYTSFDNMQQKYGIPKDYYFTLGGESPSKNSEILLKIFSENENLHLVFAGIRQLENSYLYNKYKNFKNIKFIPYIEQKDLVSLYIYAKAFLFPSIYEGFGIPLIEAMKCGCPILCSNATCLPEIAGDAALYFDPTDMSSILDRINYIENNNFIKKELIQKGIKSLNKFSWIRTANIICEVYNRNDS